MKNQSQVKSQRLSGSVVAHLRNVVFGAVVLGGATAITFFQDANCNAAASIAMPLPAIVCQDDTSNLVKANEAKADEPTIAFAYNDEEWEKVIKDFVEQTGLTLFPYSDYPEGTFTYPDGKTHTLREALDILNHNLLLKGYVLIRFNDQLILVDHVNQGFPSALIENVPAKDLEKRGAFDLVYTQFDVKGLDLVEISDQVKSLITPDRGEVVPIEAANEIRVRENVRNLMIIRDVIEKAKAAKKSTFKMKNLEYISFDTLMRIVRPKFGLDETTNSAKDGSLSVSLGSGESQIWIDGQAERVEQFLAYVAQLDLKENWPKEGKAAEYEIRSFSPATDPALAFKIVNSMFDGRGDMKMSLSEDSGIFYVEGREQDHQKIEEILKNIAADGMQLDTIQCTELDTDEMVEKIKEALGMSTGSLLEDDKGPKNTKLFFIEDSYNDLVIIRGTLPMITAAKQIAEKLDPVKPRGAKEEKPYVRITASNDDDIDKAIADFEAIWGGVARENTIQIVAPKDRGSYSGGESKDVERGFRFPSWERQKGTKLNLEDITPEQINQLRKMLLEDNKKSDEAFIPSEAKKDQPKEEESLAPKSSSHAGLPNTKIQQPELSLSVTPIVGAFIQEDEDTDEKKSDSSVIEMQTPVPVFKNEPGAPIYIERTGDGEIMLRSNDREALRIAANILSDLIDDSGIDTGTVSSEPVTFLIGFRSASELSDEIKEILGLESSGGGGGGGMGGLMGNMAQNVVGGAAGDMLGGLLGGGGLGGGGSSGDRTTGDVSIHVDNFMNALIVFANDTDLAIIESLIQLKDRPTAPHDPLVNGETRRIKISYRDPEVIKTQVETLFADLIRKPEAQGQQAGGQPNPAELMKQLMGNRGRGAGGGSAEAAKPKISVSVDTQAKLLIVMGPGNLCDQVEDLVEKLDFEGALPKKQVQVMAVPAGVNIEMLKLMFPNATQATGGTGAPGTPGSPGTPRPGTPSAGGQTAMPTFNLPANFGGFGGAGGGGNGGGGGNRGGGGGNRGGGGRGGRGG